MTNVEGKKGGRKRGLSFTSKHVSIVKSRNQEEIENPICQLKEKRKGGDGLTSLCLHLEIMIGKSRERDEKMKRESILSN